MNELTPAEKARADAVDIAVWAIRHANDRPWNTSRETSERVLAWLKDQQRTGVRP